MTNGLMIAAIGVFVTVVAQFGSIIWFAAKTAAGLTAQQNAVEQLTKVVRALQEMSASMDRRVAILEDRYHRGLDSNS